LARASPELATVSWLATNPIFWVYSLYLAICNLWINRQQKFCGIDSNNRQPQLTPNVLNRKQYTQQLIISFGVG
jgi:hypothetical protein